MASDSPPPNLLTDRRLWLMGLLGVASGLPLPLSGFTFRLWLAKDGVSLALIGLTANAGLAYSLKFLWAPALDRLRAPGFVRLGRRRGWLVPIQLALALAAFGLAAARPAVAPLAAIGTAALVAFLSASQDIVIDAWRIETFPPRAQGAALAAYVWGYRIALLIAGAGVIAGSARIGWHAALAAVAGLLALAPLVTLALPEPPAPAARPRAQGLAAAVLVPLSDLLARPGALTILGFVMLFKLGEAMAGVMTAPFFAHLGFDRAAIAVANGPLSLACAFAGTAAGGWLVARAGVGRALLATGWVQTLTMGMYLLLAVSAGKVHILAATVGVEAFAEGMADAAFLTYLSGLCSPGYAATQYALLSSLAAIGLRTVGGVSGFLAEALGWVPFYALTMFAALPAMALMLRLLRRYPPAERAVAG